jgi:formylglycine-generating enzyme required for sulfatase activity
MPDQPPGPPTPPDISNIAGGQASYTTIPPPDGSPPPIGPPPIVLARGAEVDGYRLVQRLGRGGFGEVWEAKAPNGGAVALKFVSLERSASAAKVRALALMKDIRHPHLLPMLQAWQREREGYLIIAMELADRTLLDRLREAVQQGEPGIPLLELMEYMRQTAAGIDHLNGLDIQHRDIKPANLLLVGGKVKIADFGLAKILGHTITHHTGALTPAYAPPECFRQEISKRSDQYSLAVSYCELRANVLPFAGPDLYALMTGHLNEPPDLTMLPEAERPAVARALAKKPGERWNDCREFVDALATDATRPVALTPPRPAPPPRLVARPWFRPTVAGMLTLVSLLVLASLFAMLFRHNDPAASSSLANNDKRQPGLPQPAVPPKGGAEKAPANDKAEPIPDRDKKPPPENPSSPPKKDKEEKAPAPHPGVATLPKDFTNSIGMKLVLIHPGKFKMGSPPGEHDVEISKPYYLGVYLVTQAEYEQVMGTNPCYFSAQGGGKNKVANMNTNRFPVEQVSWEDAMSFCRKLSHLPQEAAANRMYRLPTEAEWEYACREGGRSLTPFYFGNSLSSKQANFGNNEGRTTEVGSYPANNLGLYDMHGNVWQWCADWYDTDFYRKSPATDPVNNEVASNRVIRGGGWTYGAWYGRSASRYGYLPRTRSRDLGFRVAAVQSGG